MASPTPASLSRKVTFRLTEEVIARLRAAAHSRSEQEATHIPIGTVIIDLVMKTLPDPKKRKPVRQATEPKLQAAS